MKYVFLFVLFIAISVLSFSQVDLNFGLRAYYPFNGNANDVSGNYNNPVFNNATLTADRNGNPNSAYHFNGIDNYMQIPNAPSINAGQQLSICTWVKVTGFYYGPCHGNSILCKGDDDYLPGNYIMRFDEAFYNPGCGITIPDTVHQAFRGGSTDAAGYTPCIQKDQWYAVVYTYDGSNSKLYVNCVLKYDIPTAIPDGFTNSYDLFFGKLNNSSYPYWFNGDLDEVRLYDRVLNQAEVDAYSGCGSIANCTNWLSTSSANSFFRAGDVDVAGNQVTVEANINRTQPYLPGTGNDNEGDVISKHLDGSNTNYLLRPNHAYISTDNGFYGTPDACQIELNKTYHVAMVYDGTTLKYYRDGFLMSQIPAAGNLIQSNLNTQIGHYDAGFWNTQFLGDINEVRIWNVARTQAQLQTYMNASLPNPTTQPGLLAYYTFDNLFNKQGNPAFNGTLFNGASINNTNGNCAFVADSCNIIPPVPAVSIGNIINNYSPVLALNPCNNSITVENGSAYNAGDTVVIMQMKGAEIDVTNTATFGTVLNYHNAGNYEFNFVKAKTGNIIELKNKLTRQYDIPNGKVQLIRVPYYSGSVNVSSTLSCLPWDGNKGGVLVLNARDTVTLNADIDVSGKGFLGGAGFNSANPVLSCGENQYIYPSTAQVVAGLKGESIVTLTPNIVRGKGADASGGGGGLGHNSGGGGGANAGAGGFGGYQLDNCGSFLDNRGIGGYALPYSTAANKVFMGGGGGAGNADNPNNYNPTGGNGGGIVIINAGFLKSNGNIVKADGDEGLACTIPAYPDCHDGMPGGGGGGAVLANINQYIDNAIVQKKGGKGGDMINSITSGRIGPGGGGGGGMLFIKNASLPANVNSINAGGLNGVLTVDGNNPYGATAGTNGLNLFSLVIPIDTVLFKPNIDSVRIKDSNTVCRSFNFNGFGYTNTSGIASWHWNFGDAATADVQNTSHTYLANGNFNVTLTVTDVNGCKDSIIKQVTVVNCNNSISNIINDYTPVLALNPCNNALTVQDATQFNAGDTVLLIQMKGAQIDSTNTSAFGTVTNYNNAGNYEFNYVLSKAGNVIKLKNKLTRQYDLPNGRVQLIRVPYYTSTIVSATLTCLPWDGTKGGVLAFNVRDTLTLNADIDVSKNGFRGGAPGNSFLCGVADYASSFGTTGSKGEGIAELNAPWNAGGGHLANGGGGSFGGNSGAGGGSNLMAGGLGGREYSLCPGLQSIQGQALTNNLNTRIFMGGGGGGGQFDNGFLVYPGGNGGGMVFISSNHVKGNSFNINANGFSRS
ncbi:MAG: LamG-like jellyroll fold domain-containing protein, partial [Ferruginibacter sp.]